MRLAYYVSEVSWLRSYLGMGEAERGRDLAATYPDVFADFVGHLDNVPMTTTGLTADEVRRNIEEEDYEDVYYLLDPVAESFHDHVLSGTGDDYILSDPYAPAYLTMEYREPVRNQWLVHFTSDAHGIAGGGFTRGVDQPNELALTTHLPDEYKAGPGYNFAYRLEDYLRYGRSRGDSWKYGDEAVLFRASGVLVWHYGDEEPQVIFWGPSANTIIPVADVIESCRTDQVLAETAGVEESIDWIVENFAQYRRHLLCD